MKCKFSILFIFCVLSVLGQAQNVSFQELVNKKQFAAVIENARNLTAADSADYSKMSAIGQAYEGLLKYKEAYNCYRQCLSLDTLNIEALNAVARTAMSLGKASVAENSFRKVLSQDSTNFYANYQLARLYYQLGDYEKAIDQYVVLRDQDTLTVNPTIYANLGDCYMKMNAFPSATICYFKAYDVNRENAGLANTLVNTLLRLGGPNISDALAICDTALYYSPDNRSLQRSKAIAFYMNRSYKQADSVYSCLLAAGDSSFLTLKYGGASKYLSGLAMNSIPLLEEAYGKDTTDVETNLLLGAALGKTYDRKRAYELLDRAEMLMQPNEALANLLLTARGETLYRDGRTHEADLLFYRAWQKNKERLDLLFKIDMRYPNSGRAYPDDAERERALFIKNLFLKECLTTRRLPKQFYAYRTFLEYMCEDAFFRGEDDLTMTTPDGKKSKISVIDLRTLVDQLPMEPEKEEEMQHKLLDTIEKQAGEPDGGDKVQ